MSRIEWNMLDQLLYYLSHLGELHWEKFKDAVRRLAGSDSGLNPSNCLAALARLGHADYDPTTLDRVVLAPTVLVETAVQDRFVLVGSRTPGFLDEVQQSAEKAGATFQLISEQLAPVTVQIDEASPDALAVVEEMGVHISRAFSAKLANVLPSPNRSNFEQIPWPALENLRKFDTDALRFEPAERQENGDGLYQVPQYGRDIHVLKCGYDLREVPRDWGEWLALDMASRNTGLVNYDRNTQTWSVRDKLLLPLLVDRCATLCSGFPPEWGNDLVHYANVPPGVAFHLTRSLHQKWEVD